MRQLTKLEAIAFTNTDAYKKMSKKDIAVFQLQQELLCVPYSEYHECLEVALGRPVFTHEMANPDNLLKEIYGEKEPPTFDDVLDIIPKDKALVVLIQKYPAQLQQNIAILDSLIERYGINRSLTNVRDSERSLLRSLLSDKIKKSANE